MEATLSLWRKLRLKVVIYPGLPSGEAYYENYETIYRCWKDTWEQVFSREMKIDHQLFSDEFTRQDYIVSLLVNERCAGLACIRLGNPSLSIWKEDSFFRFWPTEAMNMISELSGHQTIALASFFTVSPEFRKNNYGLCWKTLLLALFQEQFLSTKASIMVTAARKVRVNEKLCQSLGAKLVCGNIPYLINGSPIEGEIADLLYWEKQPTAISPELEELRKKLWNERVDYTDQVNKRDKYAA